MKNYKLLLLTILIIIGFIFSFPLFLKQKLQINEKRQTISEKFVSAKDQNLYLHNNIFRSVGVNRYNLLSQDNGIGCANKFSKGDIDNMFSELHDLKITSVRFWLFQSFTQSGNNLDRFNYIIHDADNYGIKLIPVFENQWDNCTQGGIKTPDWYASGYLSPYGNYSLSLKDYIGEIVRIYKDNPAILAWQVINEAEDTDQTGFYNFAKDISYYIKSIDQNHLVSFGMISADSSDNYRKIHSISTIDILDYHDYNEENISMPVSLREHFLDAKILHKPLIVGESGINEDISNRASLFQAKMNSFFQNGGAVYLIWSYGDSDVTDDGYNFGFSDPVADIIKATSNIQNSQ